MILGLCEGCLEGIRRLAIERHGEIIQIHDQTCTALEGCISYYLSSMDPLFLSCRHGRLLCQVYSLVLINPFISFETFLSWKLISSLYSAFLFIPWYFTLPYVNLMYLFLKKLYCMMTRLPTLFFCLYFYVILL